MIRKIEKFLRLSAEEKRLFLEAYLALGEMRIAVLTCSFKRLTRDLEQHRQTLKLPPLDEKTKENALKIGWAIARAAANTPWESACLVQSLTAKKMLKRRGIPGVFYLGMTKEGRGEETVKAHAWTQCGDEIITGADGHELYTILSAFRW